MDSLTLENPVFTTWVIAAALGVLKVMGQGWMTVYRMMKVDAGYASPEDLRPGPLNRTPTPGQIEVNDYVDRSRRMHRNDLENIPAFWVAGFLFVQVPFMQRFSVYLGHPSHAVVVILFSMILTAGIGSLFSERIGIEQSKRFPLLQPLSIAVLLVLWTLAIQPLIENTIQLGLFTRIVLVIAAVTPPSFLMGMCFPMGMRLVEQLSPDALPWMWATNGAASVLGGVLAMGVSIWTGIDTGLLIGAGCYAFLALVATRLSKAGARRRACETASS